VFQHPVLVLLVATSGILPKMGILGCCGKFCAILVLLMAIGIGALVSGLLRQWGLFSFLDGFEVGGKASLKGIVPAMHDGTPWGFSLDEMPDLSNEVIVVTGANVGLGYWTAHHLAAKNATVVAACRTKAKCQEAGDRIKQSTGVQIETGILDLASFASIRAFAAEVSRSHGNVNSLVLNAGIMMCPFSKTVEGLEMQIGTNHFGHALLTKLLLPQLEAAASAVGVATVSVVTSSAHYSSYPEGILSSIEAMNNEAAYETAKAYGQSKLANVLFAQELAARVKDKGILVNSAHPGAVDTELGRHIEATLRKFSDTLADQLKVINTLVWEPRDAALTQLFASVGPSLRKQKITGKYYHPIARETRPDAHAFNTSLQSHLWSLTEAFIEAHP